MLKTDNLYLYAIVHELTGILEQSRIEKIYQPTQSEVIFHLRTNRGNKKLLMSIHPETFRFHLTERMFENPAQPKNFCVVLRKHLLGGMITHVEQVQRDRIVRLDIKTYNMIGELVVYTLYIELMGKYSNIILVNSTGMIIAAFKKANETKSTQRVILVHHQYLLPEAASTTDEVGFYLQPFLKKWLKKHNDATEVLLADARHPQGYYYKLNDGKAIYAFLALDEVLDIKEKLSFPLLSQAIDLYYYRETIAQQLKEKTTHLLQVVERTYKRNMKKRNKLLQEYEIAADFERYQLIGNLLLAQQHILPAHAEEVTLNNDLSSQNEMLVVALDKQKTIVQNAQIYFKKYRKAKTAVDKLQEQMAKNESEIAYFETVQQSLKDADLQQADEIAQELHSQGYLKVKNKAKKTKKTPEYAKYVYGDIEYLVGKNNLQNDYVTFKMRRTNYLWLHVKDAPGSHVLIMQKAPHTEKQIYIGALLAAYFSKMRESENVAVDYTLVQHVRKPSGAKPGYVIYKDQKTVYVTPSLTNLQKYFSNFVYNN